MPRRPAIVPTVVANWKMQLGVAESHQRLTVLKAAIKDKTFKAHMVVCPSYLALPGAKKLLRGTDIRLGAQDIWWSDRGANTGAVSPLDLQEVGVEYVIIGHSERRQQVGETDIMVGRKIISAVGHQIRPVVCVGETADDRAEGRHELIVRRQLTIAFKSVPPPTQDGRYLIAYEPVWAIGTGEPAPPEIARDMLDFIYQTMIELYNNSIVNQNIRFLYGGSVDAANVGNYVRPNGYHGTLVGGASLDPELFAILIEKITEQF